MGTHKVCEAHSDQSMQSMLSFSDPSKEIFENKSYEIESGVTFEVNTVS